MDRAARCNGAFEPFPAGGRSIPNLRSIPIQRLAIVLTEPTVKIIFLLLVASFVALQAKASSAIIINLATQRLYLFQDSKVVFVTKLSTGRRHLPTPKGSYQITEKDVCHTSSIYHVSMPYFMRLGEEAFGIHYGYNPGHPASHGCIRVGSMSEAKMLFRMTPSGTSVIID
jgi:lipoprotein-anchoring transpeptidase ErfK/SrfK